jgi:F-type H+-transporting ATPase subunit epsilon
MPPFQVNLVSPEQLLFSETADQVDLPGQRGDFGVLAGHAPMIAMLRPGIVTIEVSRSRQRFVVLGGLAEFSRDELTILADNASSVDDFDIADFKARIDEMQEGLANMSLGEELDRAIEQLDHYKSIHENLTLVAAF